MSQGPRVPLAAAQKMAERIRAALAPLCQRIEIAGSVRRQRPDCGDLDFVVLASPGERLKVDSRIRQQLETKIVREGSENLSITLGSDWQVAADFYFAKPAQNDLAGYVPGNFGMRLLAMTGSKAHNIFLAKIAEKRGIHFSPNRGLMRGGEYIVTDTGRKYRGGEVFCGEDELSILRELGQGWIPPESRENL